MVRHADNGVRQECDAETGTAGAVGGGELIQLQADIWGKAILGTELHGALVGNGLRAKQQERGLCEGRELLTDQNNSKYEQQHSGNSFLEMMKERGLCKKGEGNELLKNIAYHLPDLLYFGYH